MIYPVYVFGNPEIFVEVFNAVAITVGSSSYGTLLKVVLFIAGSMAIIQFSATRNMMVFAKFLGFYYLAFYILFIPKVTVEVIDQLKTGATEAYSIDHVPLGLAIISSYTTRIGAGLTALLEKNFSLPDDLNYSKSGLIMASKMAMASTELQVTDPQFADNISHYVTQCVYYDLLLDKYSWNDLSQSTDVWGFVTSHASPARAFLYHGDSPQILTCKEGATALSANWHAALGDAKTKIGQLLFPNSKDSANLLMSYLPLGYQTLTGISESGDKLLTQSLMLNLLQNGILNAGAETASPETVAAYAFVKARDTQRLSNETAARLAAHYLPLIQNIIEATLFGGFVIVFLFIVMLGARAIKWYVLTLAWTQLWAPLYAIVNLFMTIYAKNLSQGALGSQGVTLANVSSFASVNADLMNLAGYVSVAIPFIALGFLKLDISAFNHIAQYVGGSIQGAATASSSEAIGGNLSIGNLHYNTRSALNTTANHYDTNMRLSGGMMSSQTSSGATISVAADGTEILNNQAAMSNLGVSIHMAESIRAAASRQSQSSYTAALHEAESAANHYAVGLREIHDWANHHGDGRNSGQGWSDTGATGKMQSSHTVSQLVDSFAKDNHVSQEKAAQVLAQVYADAKTSVGGGFILKGEASTGISTSASDSRRIAGSELYGIAERFSKDHNFVDAVDTARREANESHYRTSADDGSRIAHSVASSFDTGDSLRSEANSSFNAAESYSKLSSLTAEDSAQINANYTQPFYEWLSTQPSVSGQGRMTSLEIDKMAVHDPATLQHYADQFVKEKTGSEMSQFAQSQGLTDAGGVRIEKQFEENNKRIPDVKAMDESHEQYQFGLGMQEVLSKPIRPVDESIKTRVETTMKDDTARINENKQEMIREGKRFKLEKQQVKDALQKIEE